MLDRIASEGRTNMVDDTVLGIMDNLDGQEAVASCWHRVVYGEPVLYVVGKDGTGRYVNESDCI